MRTSLLVLTVLFTMLGCAAPSDFPAPTSGPPIVGHVRVRGRVFDLTVESVDARGGEVDLHRATAQHEPEVWADTDERFFDRDGDR
jgi:hypothetical protein